MSPPPKIRAGDPECWELPSKMLSTLYSIMGTRQVDLEDAVRHYALTLGLPWQKCAPHNEEHAHLQRLHRRCRLHYLKEELPVRAPWQWVDENAPQGLFDERRPAYGLEGDTWRAAQDLARFLAGHVTHEYAHPGQALLRLRGVLMDGLSVRLYFWGSPLLFTESALGTSPDNALLRLVMERAKWWTFSREDSYFWEGPVWWPRPLKIYVVHPTWLASDGELRCAGMRLQCHRGKVASEYWSGTFLTSLSPTPPVRLIHNDGRMYTAKERRLIHAYGGDPDYLERLEYTFRF